MVKTQYRSLLHQYTNPIMVMVCSHGGINVIYTGVCALYLTEYLIKFIVSMY